VTLVIAITNRPRFKIGVIHCETYQLTGKVINSKIGLRFLNLEFLALYSLKRCALLVYFLRIVIGIYCAILI